MCGCMGKKEFGSWFIVLVVECSCIVPELADTVLFHFLTGGDVSWNLIAFLYWRNTAELIKSLWDEFQFSLLLIYSLLLLSNSYYIILPPNRSAELLY